MLPLLLLTLCGCNKEERKTPLEWCVWEINKHEDYSCTDYGYTYQDIKEHTLEEEVEKGTLYTYYITFFADDRVGYWYCGIIVEPKFPHFVLDDRYVPNEVLAIDCDLVYEVKI